MRLSTWLVQQPVALRRMYSCNLAYITLLSLVLAGFLARPPSLYANEFQVTLSRVYLDTSDGTGPVLDDDFSQDYYDGGVIRIKDAFTPALSDPGPYYWFHKGNTSDTSLPGIGLDVILSEGEEVHLVTPGGANGWMDDTGTADFRVYITNPVNVWETGSPGGTDGFLHITRLPYDEATADNIGVDFGYATGWYEGTYYELASGINLEQEISGVTYDGTMVILEPNASDVLGLRLTVSSTGEAEAYYNLNDGNWELLGTAVLDWWPENYLSVAYNIGLEHEIPEPAVLSLLALGALALVRRRCK